MGDMNPIYTSFKIPLRGKFFGNLWHVKCYKKERKGKIKNREIRKKEKYRKKKDNNLQAFGIEREKEDVNEEGRDSWSFEARIKARNLAGKQQGIERKLVAPIFFNPCYSCYSII